MAKHASDIEDYPIPGYDVLLKMTPSDIQREKDSAKIYYQDKVYATSLPWFKHYSNAHRNEKIHTLLVVDGIVGYGAYFLLLEHLNDKEHHCYNINKLGGWHTLASDLYIDVDTCKKIMEHLQELKLILPFDDGIITNSKTEQNVQKQKARYAQQLHRGWCTKLTFAIKAAKEQQVEELEKVPTLGKS